MSTHLEEKNPQPSSNATHALDHIIAFILLQNMTQPTQLQRTVKQAVLIDRKNDKVEEKREDSNLKQNKDDAHDPIFGEGVE
jgi:hypothetical protein